MNKILLFLLTLSLFIKIGHSQTNIYHSFPDSSYWRVDAEISWNNDCSNQYYYHYYFKGDTVINSNYYKKLIRSKVLFMGDSSCFELWPWAVYTGYLGAIRDDSTANKTFYIQPDDSIENILFDYNLAVGDTIKGVIESNNTTITSIDSVIIITQERKRWNFNSGYIIQGIGSSKGLIEGIRYGEPGSSSLICVRDSNSTIFNSGVSSSMGCQLITSIKNSQPSTSDICIFPNPFNNFTTIESTLLLNDGELFVYNFYGQEVKRVKNISGYQIKLYKDNLLSGLYFIRLTQDNKVLMSDKIIIID